MTSAEGSLTFLVPGNQGLCDGLTDGVDLGCVTTTLNTDADVHLTVSVGSEEEHWLPDLWRTDEWDKWAWRSVGAWCGLWL